MTAVAFAGRRRDRMWAIGLVLGLLVVYNLDLRIVSEGDSTASRYLPFCFWRGSVSLDPVAGPAREVPPGIASTVPYWTWISPSGHLYSSYPVVTPLLVAPLDLPAVLLLDLAGWSESRLEVVALVMEKLAASLVAALASGGLFLLLRRRLDRRPALLLTIAFALGTETWVISSQALWEHGVAELLLVLALLALTGRGRPWLVGGLCGLLVANRPPDAILALPFLAALLLRDRRQALVGVGAAVGTALPFVVYNLHVFGTLAGGYGRLRSILFHPFFRRPILPGLAGLLVSPAKGLLVFAPFFAFLGLRFRRDLRDPGDGFGRLDLLLALAAAAQLLFFARTDWRGGGCYGPRYLTDQMPILVWLLAPVVGRLSGVARPLFAVAVAAAIAVQAIGAFCYRSGGSDLLYYPPGHPRLHVPPAVWRPSAAAFRVEARRGLADPFLLPVLVHPVRTLLAGERPPLVVPGCVHPLPGSGS